MATWQVQNAKARLSEVIERACTEGPQMITRHGAERAVVLSIETIVHSRRTSRISEPICLGAPRSMTSPSSATAHWPSHRALTCGDGLPSRYQHHLGDAQTPRRRWCDHISLGGRCDGTIPERSDAWRTTQGCSREAPMILSRPTRLPPGWTASRRPSRPRATGRCGGGATLGRAIGRPERSRDRYADRCHRDQPWPYL